MGNRKKKPASSKAKLTMLLYPAGAGQLGQSAFNRILLSRNFIGLRWKGAKSRGKEDPLTLLWAGVPRILRWAGKRKPMEKKPVMVQGDKKPRNV